MVMFSIIQLGFTRFLTDRKEWIYLPLSDIYVCVVCGGVPDIGGSASGFWLPFWILPRKKNATRPLLICPSAWLITAPERLDWVCEWVQQSGLMPICPGNQAHFRREVVGLLTPCLYV